MPHTTPSDPSAETTTPEASHGGSEPTWDQRILALLPSSVDIGQLRENLRRTPTERVELMLDLVAFIEAQRSRARVRPSTTR